MTALLKAVEGTPNAAVVYTLAIGKDNRATDAYSQENQFIADQMAEAESVSARKAVLLDPTGEDETVKVLRRRLFETVDDVGQRPWSKRIAGSGRTIATPCPSTTRSANGWRL